MISPSGISQPQFNTFAKPQAINPVIASFFKQGSPYGLPPVIQNQYNHMDLGKGGHLNAHTIMRWQVQQPAQPPVYFEQPQAPSYPTPAYVQALPQPPIYQAPYQQFIPQPPAYAPVYAQTPQYPSPVYAAPVAPQYY